jgi:hypothetical protein
VTCIVAGLALPLYQCLLAMLLDTLGYIAL